MLGGVLRDAMGQETLRLSFSTGSLSMPGGLAIFFGGGEAFAGSLSNEARAQQAWVYVLVLVMALLVSWWNVVRRPFLFDGASVFIFHVYI